jgi:N-acyl-D-amino-acid deacylase
MDNQRFRVRGGTVLHGTGNAPRRGDVRARGGRIAETDPGLRPDSERVLDASGAYVAPGFIGHGPPPAPIGPP